MEILDSPAWTLPILLKGSKGSEYCVCVVEEVMEVEVEVDVVDEEEV